MKYLKQEWDWKRYHGEMQEDPFELLPVSSLSKPKAASPPRHQYLKYLSGAGHTSWLCSLSWSRIES